MKYITFLFLISNITLAAVPNTFKSGDLATAKAFNENFQSIDLNIESINSELITLKGQVSEKSGEGEDKNLKAGYISAEVNGVVMQVSSSMLGHYSIITPKGHTVSVDIEGNPSVSWIYYESNDCSGEAFYSIYQITNSVISNEQGYTFSNPKLSTDLSIIYDGTNILYSLNNEIIKLNYSSGFIGGKCHITKGTSAVTRLIANDSEVTGIESFPLIISGVGSTVSISEEIGEDFVGTYKVFANGTYIGETDRKPDRASDYISVKLTNYNNKNITLYKDGTYSGGGFFSSKTLYFVGSDCTGASYVKVLDDSNRNWWNANLLDFDYIMNDDKYYTLSTQVYRAPASVGSYRNYYNSGVCSNSSTALDMDAGYQIATETPNIDIPSFTTPITVEGYSEPTQINSLPVMN